MTDSRTRVLVVGGGPAGLAAAARVLEKGGPRRFRVRLATLGHHFGGKASSWRDAEGRIIDHGQHIIVGWYYQMKGLLARAGVDVDARLVSGSGHTYVYESRDDRVHDLALKRNPFHVLARAATYSGFSGKELTNVTGFALRNLGSFAGLGNIARFDDVCFTTWCLQNGISPSIVRTNAFHLSRDAQLNWPHEISAYVMLKQLQVIGRDYRTTQYSFCDGGMSERFWDPIVMYIGRMGGEIELMRKLEGFRYHGDRITGALFAEPDSGGHDAKDRDRGRSMFEDVVPPKPDSTGVDDDFDFLISTVPASSFQALNPGDATFWAMPTFARIRRLRGVVPMGMQIWHRNPVTKRYKSVVSGLAGPLRYVLDNKHIIREYRYNPRYGSVLYFVGQETSYESWSDEKLLELCLANVARLPGFERIDRAGILHYQVVRNRGLHKRYTLTEPGAFRYRPQMTTPFTNLMLGGDWVRNELDFPCMEAAIRSGQNAADAVIKAA